MYIERMVKFQQQQEGATGAQPEQGGVERPADPTVLGQDGGAPADGRPGGPGQRAAPRPHRLLDGLPDQTQAGLCQRPLISRAHASCITTYLYPSHICHKHH